MKISSMTKNNSSEVIEVLTEAFNDYSIKIKGKPLEGKRKPESIHPYLEIEPKGCFIASDRKEIIGAIFCHKWGKIGWIGTFGVLPKYQAKGIGKGLLVKAIEYLDKKCNVTTLGLETFPENNLNIGLFSKCGFKPAFQTIKVVRPIIISPVKQDEFNNYSKNNKLEVALFSKEENKNDAYNRCSWLASKIENGLDYNSEIKITEDYHLGDTILIKKEGFIIGYAICRTESKYQTSKENLELDVKIAVLDRDFKDIKLLDYLLYVCEEFGHKKHKVQLKLGINSSYWLVYQYFLQNNFRVKSTILRMVKFSEDIKAYDRSNEWLVNCSSWTM